MKLEALQAEWEKDSKLNLLDIASESAKIPALHSKYWKIMMSERLKLRKFEADLKQLSNDKFWFFLHGHDEDTRAKGWELPARGKITVKEEAKQLVDSDNEVITLTLKIAALREKCLFLEDIIKSVHNRSYTINNIIQWKKFEAGG